MALGVYFTPALGPSFLGTDPSLSVVEISPSVGVAIGVLDLGLGKTDTLESVSSSSSSPNESLPLATVLRFFFVGWGVEALYFGC